MSDTYGSKYPTGQAVDDALDLAVSAVQPEDVAVPTGGGQADGLMTHEDKAKLDGIETVYAPLASPALTGNPTAPTATQGDSDTSIATTAFVNAEIAADATPIAHVGATGAAHGNVTTSVAGFMIAADKTKLDGIATGATANTGTVTSVGLSLPAEFTVSNSPVTTSGSLTAVKASQAANQVYAAPNGSSGVPTFRSLVADDIPQIAYSSLSEKPVIPSAVYVNVMDHGADPTGDTDSLAAFNSALAAIDSRGGVLFIPNGKYALSDTLVIGNGTATTDSTIQSIRMEGENLSMRGYNTVAPNYRFSDVYGTTITRFGNLNTPLITFNGPIGGCGISNMVLNGAGKAAKILEIWAANNFNLINCRLEAATEIVFDADVHENIVSRPYGVMPGNVYMRVDSCCFDASSTPGSVCMHLSGDVINGGADTFGAFVSNCLFFFNGMYGIGILADFVDSSTFTDLNFIRNPQVDVSFNKTTQTFTYNNKPAVQYQLKEGDIISFGTVTGIAPIADEWYSGTAIGYDNDTTHTYLKPCVPNRWIPNREVGEYYFVKNRNTTNGTFQLAHSYGAAVITNIQNFSTKFGFSDSSTSISFNNSTRVFTLTGTNWKYYINDTGVEYTVATNKTVTLSATPATYYIVISNNTIGTLSSSTTRWDNSNSSTIPIAKIVWNGSTGVVSDYRPYVTNYLISASGSEPDTANALSSNECGSHSVKFETPGTPGNYLLGFPSQLNFYHVNFAGGPPAIDLGMYGYDGNELFDINFYGYMLMDGCSAPTHAGQHTITDTGVLTNFSSGSNFEIVKPSSQLKLRNSKSNVNAGHTFISNTTEPNNPSYPNANFGLLLADALNGVDHNIFQFTPKNILWNKAARGSTDDWVPLVGGTKITSPSADVASLKLAVDAILTRLGAL